MRRIQKAVFAALIILVALPAMPWQGKVIVEGLSTKELRRTAHRMRIPIEQLKNARAALQEATDMVPRLNPRQLSQLFSLGSLWIRINQPKASSVLESLVADAKSDAAEAADAATYGCYTNWAQMLLGSYAQLEPDKALELLRQWPAPPGSEGNTDSARREAMEKQLQRAFIQGMANQDPERALTMLTEQSTSAPMDYSMQAQLIRQLAMRGKKDEALKLADQAIESFRRQSTQNPYGGFSSLVQALPDVDPDRFLSAFQLLCKPGAVPVRPGIPASPGTLKFGDQVINTTPEQAQMLSLLRNLYGRPNLLQKALDAQPDLKSVVDRIGGIDNFFNPPAGMMTISYGSGSSGWGSGNSAQGILFQELRGKAAKNPGLVRQKLAESFNTPEELQDLINLANRARYEDPDMGSIALEIGEGLVFRIESLQKQAEAFQNLARAYWNLDGEVSTDLLRKGFMLVEQLRQEETRKTVETQTGMRSGFSSADYFEDFLLGQSARQSFDAAMQYVHAFPQDGRKVRALLKIIENLVQNY